MRETFGGLEPPWKPGHAREDCLTYFRFLSHSGHAETRISRPRNTHLTPKTPVLHPPSKHISRSVPGIGPSDSVPPRFLFRLRPSAFACGPKSKIARPLLTSLHKLRGEATENTGTTATTRAHHGGNTTFLLKKKRKVVLRTWTQTLLSPICSFSLLFCVLSLSGGLEKVSWEG